MSLQKQSANMNFQQGLDQKTDPNQVPLGKFVSLVNTIFQKIGRLTKRFGFPRLTTAPDSAAIAITTFKENLISLGSLVYSYSAGLNIWNRFPPTEQTLFTPVSLSIQATPLIRNSTTIQAADLSVSSVNGIGMIASFSTSNPGWSVVTFDSTITKIFPRTSNSDIPVLATAVFPTIKTFAVNNSLGYAQAFVSSGTISINMNFISATNINASGTVVSIATGLSSFWDFDVIVVGTNVWITYFAGSDQHVSYVDSSFTLHGPFTQAAILTPSTNGNVSITYDRFNPTIIWCACNDGIGGTSIVTFAVNSSLSLVIGPLTFTDSNTGIMTMASYNQSLLILCDIKGAASPDGTFFMNHIDYMFATQGGATSGPLQYQIGAELASKLFDANEVITPSNVGAFQVAIQYNSNIEPTYFLFRVALDNMPITSSTIDATILTKWAFENGIQNLAPNSSTTFAFVGIPQVSIYQNQIFIPYLIRDFILSTMGTEFITQAGLNYLQVNQTLSPVTIESANALQISGGFLASYDGFGITEQNFFLFPEAPALTIVTSGGHLPEDTYFYVIVFEAFDQAGNYYRSAPSVPSQPVTTGNAVSSIVVLFTPLKFTFRLDVQVVIYRYSLQNPVYTQVVSLLNKGANETDSYTDSAASVLGGNILYTTGGVVENIGPPSSQVMALYRDRFFLVDAETPDILWYSKNIIPGTALEMSDLFTLTVPSNYGDQKLTTGVTALGTMDDKLIIFKNEKTIYYILGIGPDNTGANNDFQDPTIITASVGCNNQNSLVLIPSGLMFQSDKGFWLLDRSLGVSYIGAPAEGFNNALVTSAQQIPETTQVRFTLNNGNIIYYDYFFQQWGSFSNTNSPLNAISSCLYENEHTLLLPNGLVLQETPNSYVDAGNTTFTFSFTTGWISLAGLQGFQRIYYLYLLADYLSSHTITVSIAYDYDSTIVQTSTISPTTAAVEQWRVNFARQKCEAIQITVQENVTGTGGPSCTISGINFVFGGKSTYPRLPAAVEVP